MEAGLRRLRFHRAAGRPRGEIKLVGLFELKSGIVFKVIYHAVALHIFLRHGSFPHLAMLYDALPFIGSVMKGQVFSTFTPA